jgi:hypothetical protein
MPCPRFSRLRTLAARIALKRLELLSLSFNVASYRCESCRPDCLAWETSMAVKHVLAAIGLALVVAPAALADPFRINVDQTVVLKIRGSANSVVVGNASVADVAVHDGNTLLVTGKSFGTTNLMVLDGAGNTIYSNQVAVGAVASSDMTIVRADGTYTYSCVDKCRSTATVGDAPNYFSETMSTLQGKIGVAKGSGN